MCSSLMLAVPQAIIGGMTFSDQLRRAIDRSGITRYRLAAEADVSEAMLSRFMNGSAGLHTQTIDRIAEVLRLELNMKGPRKAVLGKRRR